MYTINLVKEEIRKELSLNGEALCEWDEGFDYGLRLAMEWIKKHEAKDYECWCNGSRNCSMQCHPDNI